MQDRRRTTYRYTLRITMTPEEEQAYRAEHALGERDSTRLHLASHIQDQLDGEGTLTGWWSGVQMR